MKFQLIALVLVCGVILIGAHYIFKAIPKPNYADRGEATMCNPIPEFSDFRVTSGSAPVTVPVNLLSNSRAEAMKSEILTATSSGTNFAGQYLLVEAGCGIGCQNHAIVDSTTGSITEYGLRTTGGVQFRIDSSLLIVNPTGLNTTRYYNLVDGQLHYLCEKY